MKRILLLFVFLSLLVGRAYGQDSISQNNKDVFILSTLIQNYLRHSGGRDLNLTELIQNDSLKRISNSFDKIEGKYRGGYIAVYYTFSKSRNNNIELTDKEKEKIKKWHWKRRKIRKPFDGEIQFEYGERFYILRKIKVKK